MDYFTYRRTDQGDALFAEDVALTDIAREFGTPAYVYSRATLERHYRAFDNALGDSRHKVCYAVKANGNLAVLNVLARLGAGFDIVSVGELERVLAAGGDPAGIVFSGVGKRDDELIRALEVGIHCFNVESETELMRLAALASGRGLQAPIALRVNPDVDARTHPYISTGLAQNKFGIDIKRAESIYLQAAKTPGLKIIGVACHIGSQLLEINPFNDALDRVLALADRLTEAGVQLSHIDVGGGLGVRYRDETPPEPGEWARALRERLGNRNLAIHCEPGRAIAGNAGVLLTRVELLKKTSVKNFAIVDAAMNDLLRPALYDAYHDIVPVERVAPGEQALWDVVGPICESGDFLGRGRDLSLAEGALLAVRTAGAYGFAMSNNYNTRPRPPELMVDGAKVHVVRARESLADLWRGEQVIG